MAKKFILSFNFPYGKVYFSLNGFTKDIDKAAHIPDRKLAETLAYHYAGKYGFSIDEA